MHGSTHRSRQLAWLYGLTAALEIAADAAGVAAGVYVLKPLLMPLLICYLVAGMEWRSKLGALLLGALACSWAGDLLMMTGLFLGGLGAFLMAHVCYGAAFLGGGGGQRVTPGKLAGWLLLAAFGGAMLWLLTPHLDDALRVPVYCYMAVILGMGALAVDRHGRTAPQSFWLVAVGAALFIASDSVIALNKFVAPVPGARALIMASYTLAQFLIIRGVLADRPRA